MKREDTNRRKAILKLLNVVNKVTSWELRIWLRHSVPPQLPQKIPSAKLTFSLEIFTCEPKFKGFCNYKSSKLNFLGAEMTRAKYSVNEKNSSSRSHC